MGNVRTRYTATFSAPLTRADRIVLTGSGTQMGRSPRWRAVSSLLDNNVKPNLSDKRSRTPLLEAAQNGHEHIVNLLLQPPTAESTDEHGRDKREKVNVDARDMGQTVLMLAAENGYEHVVDSLLKNNADSGLRDNGRKKAWQRAMENGHVRVVNNLLKLRQDAPGQDLAVVNDALLLASRKGWTELVEVLLDREADATFQAKGSQSTALHLAAMGGHVQVVKKLLDKGVDVATKDAKDRTALMLATEHWFESIVQVLLEQAEKYIKRDINDCMGSEALHCAAEKGFAGIVRELLETGAAVDACDAVGRTAMGVGGHQRESGNC
jgi:ankyrin repeat protein